MAKPDDDVNGLLADIERAGIMERRAFSAPYWTPAERRQVLKQIGEVLGSFKKKAIALGAPESAAAARTPRRKPAKANGTTHANGATRRG